MTGGRRLPGRFGRAGLSVGAAGGRSGRAAFTLVEVLVALALAALLGAALLATVRGSVRAGSLVSERAEAGQAGPLASALLRFEIERAGRALDAGGLRVVLGDAGTGSDVLEVRYLAEAHRAEAVAVDAAFFTAEDSQGRPNLYRRPRDGIRQPWLLGVTGLEVIGGVAADGSDVARADLPGLERAAGLVVEVRFDDGSAHVFTAATGRAGTVEIAIAPP